MFLRILTELYKDSPKHNLAKLRARLTGQPLTPPKIPQKNKVLDELLASSCLAELVMIALARIGSGNLLLAGENEPYETVADRLTKAGRAAKFRPWEWAQSAHELDPGPTGRLILCRLPVTETEWTAVAELKKRIGGRLTLLTELLLPFTRITFLQGKLDYAIKDLVNILPYYVGEKYFGAPLEILDTAFSLRGRRVIEFGPFDGCQTAGLVHLGAASVTCIETRAENATKTLTAVDVFGWSNVKVVMEDLHNADATKYGRFDVAFAHGVYYHSIAPFVFLENLRGLADHIFLGGFCATDDLPAGAWEQLEYQDRTYRAKRYREAKNFTAGVNPHAWFFHGDDLMRFFTEREWNVQMIADEATTVTAGRYVRFLAVKPSGNG